MMIHAIALDDEPLALELLGDYAAKIPFLALKGTFTDPFEAMRAMQEERIDLLFLDIQMPDLTGFQFLQTLKATPPALVFTTAYKEYGVEGFNHDAVDYLLKPYSFDRFTKAVNKVQEWLGQRTEAPVRPFLFIKSEHQLVNVMLADIRWIEAFGDYVKVFTASDKPLLTLTSLNTFAQTLPDDFIRVHRSFIVHKLHINMVQKNRIVIGDRLIPLGESYQEAFYRQLPEV